MRAAKWIALATLMAALAFLSLQSFRLDKRVSGLQRQAGQVSTSPPSSPTILSEMRAIPYLKPIIEPSRLPASLGIPNIYCPSPYVDGPTGRVYLLFSGMTGGDGGSKAIGCAFSSAHDLFHWIIRDSPVLTRGSVGEWDDAYIYPVRLYHWPGSDYKLFYEGVNSSGVHALGLATSPTLDPMQFTKYAGNPVLRGERGKWDENFKYQFWQGTHRSRGGQLAMLYRADDTSNREILLGWAYSSDEGKTWTKDPGNPVLNLTARSAKTYTAEPAFLVQLNGLYILGGETNAAEGMGKGWSIGNFFYSEDGYHWQHLNMDPITPVHPFSEIDLPTLCYYEGEYFLIHSARKRLDNSWNIAVTFLTSSKVAMPMLEKSSLAPASSSTLKESTPVFLGEMNSLALTVECTYDALATSGIKVHIYTSCDGIGWDTEEQRDASGNPIFGDMPFSVGGTARKTKSIPSDARFINITIDNQDNTRAVSNLHVTATLPG